MRSFIKFTLQSTFVLLFFWGCQPAETSFPLHFGIGQTVYDMPTRSVSESDGSPEQEPVYADSAETVRLVREAVEEALQAYGNEKPRLLWIMGRIESREIVRATLAQCVPEGIPYLFDGSYWRDYGPIGPEAVSTQNQQSVLAIALGGEVNIEYHTQPVEQMEVGDWALEEHYGEEKGKEVRKWERERHQKWGKALAEQFDVPAEGTNLFFQMGTQHVPRHIWINEGLEEVFAGHDVQVAGGAQADFGWQIHDEEIVEAMVYGILINGDFEAIQVMEGRNRELAADLQLAQLLRRGQKHLSGRVNLGFYFGCAGWNQDNQAQWDTLQQVIPSPVVGRFNGGELGRRQPQAQNEAEADLASIVLLSH